MTPETNQWTEQKVTPIDDDRPQLCYRTISSPSGPDRFTIFPIDATGVTKMSTWLTVNNDCVVDLDFAR